jgi:predicted phage terminase large subunit-like protein
VHVVIGVDPENRMYLLDPWRGQTSSDVWIEAWCDLVKKWRPSFWAEEHGQIIAGVGPFLERRAIERQAYTHREQFPSRVDKAVRAQSMRGRIGLYVRQGAPWFADLRAELLSFPVGSHDDQVDALGLVQRFGNVHFGALCGLKSDVALLRTGKRRRGPVRICRSFGWPAHPAQRWMLARANLHLALVAVMCCPTVRLSRSTQIGIR